MFIIKHINITNIIIVLLIKRWNVRDNIQLFK